MGQIDLERLPSGLGEDLNEWAKNQAPPSYVICGQVGNEVVVVNPKFPKAPFPLKTGSSTELGLFAHHFANESDREFADFLYQKLSPYPDKSRKNRILEHWPPHHRSLLLRRIIFSDQQGRLYRDVDLKGVGYLHQGILLPPGALRGASKDRDGLLDFQDATNDYLASEELTAKGVRTHRVISIIKINQIICDGQYLSLDEAIGKRKLSPNYEPVIAVRAYGTRARIEDVALSGHRGPTQLLFLKDALALFGQEFGENSPTLNQYMYWFAETLGKNIGIMHSHNLTHHWPTSHNITLDCRIVDMDTMIKAPDYLNLSRDFDLAKEALISFHDSVSTLLRFDPILAEQPIDSYEVYLSILEGAYDAAYRQVLHSPY